MKKLFTSFVALLLLAGVSAEARRDQMSGDSIVQRAVVLSGDATHPIHRENLMLMNVTHNQAFEDPAAPRFLFLDKEGKVALGIGGSLKGVAMYDMCGAINDNGFVTNEIPVPLDPAQRNRFGATANHSSIFLQLVTGPTRLGRIQVYVQSQFSGSDGGGYGFILKQAYVKVGHVTLGKARTTFADGPAMAPTVDDQGPSGQVSAKNMLVQYASSDYKGFSAAISAELPSASYTTGSDARSISQRFPDIPAYVQYAWDKGDSHIRLSGILRELSYRDNLKQANHFATGWGVQFSTIANIAGGLDIFGHYTYGKGIGDYVNDLSGEGYDLIPSAKDPGKLVAPASGAFTGGLQYTFSPRLFVSASYSQARLYDAGHLGGDTYRYGQYLVANAFYNPIADLRLGLEYLHGNRTDYSGQSGKANRLMAMIQYSF